MSDKMLRWGRLVAVLAALALVAAACGDDETPSGGGETGSTGPTGTTAAEPFRVALVAPSATNDLAFTQSMFDALNVLKESENLEIAVSDNLFVVDDAASAISNYASQGYDLVIAHGSQFGGSVEQIALEFPEVSFAWGTAGDTFGQPNVYAYQAASMIARKSSRPGLPGVFAVASPRASRASRTSSIRSSSGPSSERRRVPPESSEIRAAIAPALTPSAPASAVI